jgi:hypothetical protein
VISSATRANQQSRILGLLVAGGDWASLLAIKECAAQYNSRIFELRRLGFRIANKIREVEGMRMSWFRLESPSPPALSTADASPQPKEISPEKASSFPWFGTLARERYGVD